MKSLFTTLYILSIFLLWGCSNGSTEIKEESRPHDPWIFRSVLDLNPRVVTLALDEDMWVAYHAGDCALYQAWKGEVNFDGPVYTTHHGPQPTSIGNRYLVNIYRNPWGLKTNGNTTQLDARYLGHKIEQDDAVLMYELTTPSLKNKIYVNEKIEYAEKENGLPILKRTFTTNNIQGGQELVLLTNFSAILVKAHIVTDGKLVYTFEKDTVINGKSVLELGGELTLNSNAKTELSTTFLADPLIYNPNNPEEEKEDASLPEGLRLIAKSDCKTCHNKNVKTIGPSYVDIANRYISNQDNIKLLSSKIKTGGGGVWGNQVMTPHADLSDRILSEMVSYILSLRTAAENINASDDGNNEGIAPAEVNADDLIPGLYTEVRNIPGSLTSVAQLNYTKRPIQAGIMPKFGNISGVDFGDLMDNFSLRAEGYIKIEEAGNHTFRLWSDDGSALYISGEKVIDNDGPHGAEYKEVSLDMVAGYFPVTIEFFQGGGGKFLSFNWKPQGQGEFTVVPFENLWHPLEKRSSLRGYTLAMANIKKIPGNKFPLEDMHPSFDLAQARPLTFTPKVGGLDFMSDGSLIVSTWDAAGSVYRLTNMDAADPDDIQATKIAQGLAEPLGLKVVDDTIYIMQKQELTKLIDNDNDGIIDEYRTVSDQWGVSANFHEFGFGLAYKDGYFYATLATAIDPGGASTQPQIQDRGRVVRISKKDGTTSFIASGLRTPNGIGWGFNNGLYVADNQGDWLPSSKIVHVEEGDWFGSRSVDPEGTKNRREKRPVVWLPQDEIGNSPSTPSYINVGPYKNQMIHGEVTHGGIKRVFVEEIDGQYQGAVFRFIQGLEAGVNRIVWGPDGSLYVGGIGSTGNWGHSGKLHYGLQKITYNNKPTLEMLAISAKTNGIEIEFTEPLRDDAWEKSRYDIYQFYYEPTANYGGPKLGEHKLPIQSVNVSEDGKKVFLELSGMKENHVIYVHIPTPFISRGGNPLFSAEAWYTMNKIPSGRPGIKTKAPAPIKDNQLTAFEKSQGWELLFDGKTTDNWRNYNKTTTGSSWKVQNGELFLNVQTSADGSNKVIDGGDLMTEQEFENFEFSYDWKIGNCGNSGIIFNVVESSEYGAPYLTGPEMQILDNVCHPDTKFPTHRAGDLYDMIETKYVTVNPAGEWNRAKIISNKGKMEFWLNGYKVVDFEMHTDAWDQMVANSKFKDWEAFGKAKKGHIVLQDHGDPVFFKNIKIRNLDEVN
jgi:cytochrome c